MEGMDGIPRRRREPGVVGGASCAETTEHIAKPGAVVNKISVIPVDSGWRIERDTNIVSHVSIIKMLINGRLSARIKRLQDSVVASLREEL